MGYASIQNSFIGGEFSPELYGRTDLPKYQQGASTMRNMWVNYRGGATTRAGFKYIGMCKQGAPNSGGTATDDPPVDIPFQLNLNTGYVLEFGDAYMRVKYQGAYVVESAKNVTAATNADPAVFTSALHGYSDGDWLYITGMPGTLNNIIYATTFASNALITVDDGTQYGTTGLSGPQGVCVSPDGNKVYVANSSNATVSIINAQTRQIIATVSVGTTPSGLAITPDGSEVYVANFGSNNVSVISTVSNTVTNTVAVGINPESVAILPDGSVAYVTNGGAGTVTPITIASHTAGSAITVGSVPAGIAATPDSAFVYVANFGSDSVKVIETSGNTVTATITVGDGPQGIVVTPDGDFAYVANYNAGSVSVITTASNTVTATILSYPKLFAIAASSDSSLIFVNSEIGTLTTISVASNTVIAATTLGAAPTGAQSLAVYSQATEANGFATLNGLAWIVTNKTANTYRLTDLFGNVVDSSTWDAYTAGGQTERIYTLTTSYAAADLEFLKYTQNDTVLSLALVNQETDTEYKTYDLTYTSATSWSLDAVSFAAAISAPTGVSVTAQASTTLSTWYSYVVTAVDAETGEESIASSPANVQNNDISVNAGSNTIQWIPVAGAGSYNIYATTPIYSTGAVSLIPIGAAYGFLGSSFGTQFVDTNIITDFTIVPPTHQNPFARGAIARVNVTAAGASYSQSSISYTITTSTGSGFVGTPIAVSGAFVGFYVQNHGEGYTSSDTIAITSTMGGTGATATLTIGATSGTYPGEVAYFQQRRGYAYTLNQPNTYFFSQPGLYTNMDSALPLSADDAIIGTPWAQQVNGVQFMVPMPTGLIILTGGGAWLLTGGNNAALTPIDQTATAQAYNGCHFHLRPLVVNYDIFYVQSKGSIVRDLSFNFFTNVYTGLDKTILSSHLFNFRQMQSWCYTEEPFKIIWVVRDDGTLLSFTVLKEQNIEGWARHDTNGLLIRVCSITEPPVDALYAIIKRYIVGEGVWAYYSERADNRNWPSPEDCFCVDAGLSYPMTFPNAVLTPTAADGGNNISSVLIVGGGSGYTSPTATAVDATGMGSGASFTVTVSSGVITAITPVTQGQNYTKGATSMIITDSTGTDAVVYPNITNIVNFTTDNGVFTADMIGDVIRINNNNASIATGFAPVPNGGGKAVITSVYSSTAIAADIIEPITNVIPDNDGDVPLPVNPNYWSLSTPTKTVTGLNHLEGMQVSILADGSVVTPQTVIGGTITLPIAASAITIGLPFICQLQTLYLDAETQTGTMQGARKNIQAVTVRMQNSRGIQVGTNQPDASTQPNGATVPWENMISMKERDGITPPGTAIPLITGDRRALVPGKWAKPGQIAIQITDPLPATILAIIPEWQLGDTRG